MVSNPPYGPRLMSKTEDPDSNYRISPAFAYFLRRGLDLLARNGIGVFLFPTGFMSGKGPKHRALRRAVLLRHHVSAAFRLPSAVFAGAHLVTDLIFFRARGVVLTDVDLSDASLLDGLYFKQNPTHILGREVGSEPDADEDEDERAEQPKKHARFGYQVEGVFTGLPEFTERPMCASCQHLPPAAPAPAPRGPAKKRRCSSRIDVELASTLGHRAAKFVAQVSAQQKELPALAWRGAAPGAHRLDEATWRPCEGQRPPPCSPKGRRVRALPPDVRGGEHDARPRASEGAEVGAALPRDPRRPGASGRPRVGRVPLPPAPRLAASGFARPGSRAALCGGRRGRAGPLPCCWTRLLRSAPAAEHAAALVRAALGDQRAAEQAEKLRELIKPAAFAEIRAVTPRGQGWVPLELIEGWLGSLQGGRPGFAPKRARSAQAEGHALRQARGWGENVVIRAIGWCNHEQGPLQALGQRHPAQPRAG